MTSALVCVFIFQNAFAWNVFTPDKSQYFWVYAGAGTTHQTWSAYGLGIGANVTMQRGADLWMLRWDQNYEVQHDTYGGDELVRQPEQNIYDIGLLYGQSKRSRWFLYGIAAGVAYVHGVKRGDFLRRDFGADFERAVVYEFYEKKTFDTVGLPVVLRGSVQALENIGIELELYSVFNPVRTYSGWLFGLQVGHLR